MPSPTEMPPALAAPLFAAVAQAALMLALVIGFTALSAWLIPKLYRLARRGFQALRARLRGERSVGTPAATPLV